MKNLIWFVLVFVIGIFETSEKDYLMGKFNPENDARFSKLMAEHTAGSAKGGVLRKETYDAFIAMAEAAKKEGIHLVIISATRNFEKQKKIWENKWNGKVSVEGKNLTTIKDPVERAKIILHYSSMPGSSRHHWGTDMDLNSLENTYFESGIGLKTYLWLQAHASQYGFCQPFTSKSNGRTGYEEEKWHWSYLALSKGFLDNYRKHIHDEDFEGFTGSETASKLGIIENYVMGVGCGNQ